MRPWIKLLRMEGVAKRHNSKILYRYINILRWSSEFGLVSVKYRNVTTISDQERVKERRAEHFENVLKQDRVTGKILEIIKICDTLDVKEDLFCDEELATVLKGLKINKAPCAVSAVNEFLKYGSVEVRNKLLKITNLI